MKLIRLFCVCISLVFCFDLNAQHHDVSQKAELSNNFVKAIEKYRVDSLGFEKLIERSDVNKLGYIFKRMGIDTLGNERLFQEFNYDNDTLLLETKYLNTYTTKYNYDSNNLLKSFAYYDGESLVTEIEYKFNKEGKIIKSRQRWIGNNKTGAYKGKEDCKYIYNAKKQLVEIRQATFIKKKKKEEKSTIFIYNNENNSKMTYEDDDAKPEPWLRYKEQYDKNKKLLFAEQYYMAKSNMSSDFGNHNYKNGDVGKIEYKYDSRGLLEKEILYINDKYASEVRYKYITY